MKCTIVQCSGGWEGQRAESCCCHFGQELLCAQLSKRIMGCSRRALLAQMGVCGASRRVDVDVGLLHGIVIPSALFLGVPFAPGVPAAVHCFLRGLLPDGNTFMNVTNACDALMFPGWVPEIVRRRRRCLEDVSGWHTVTSAE